MAALPEPMKSLRAALETLSERVRRVENRSPLYNTGLEQVDAGQLAQTGSVVIPDNGLLMVDGGDVVMLDEAPSAVELFRLGLQQFTDRGLTVRRADGSVVFEIKKIFGPTDLQQKFRIYDGAGRVMAGDAILSFSGFDAPHMAMPFIPVDYTKAVADPVTSTTFVATHEHRGFRQNPALKPQLMVKCSDGTTSAQIQFWDVLNSVYLGGFLGSPATHTITVPTGTTAFTLFELPSSLILPGSMSDAIHLQVHVKRTAGAGSVSVAPVRMIGTGV